MVMILIMVGPATGAARASDVAIGDSIAQGVGQALGIETRARVGAGSCWIKNAFSGGSYANVVISAGINDPPGQCIAALRYSIHAQRVVWVLPAAINSARLHVAAVAASFDDLTVSYACQGGCSKRNFHPASYPALANMVRRAWAVH